MFITTDFSKIQWRPLPQPPRAMALGFSSAQPFAFALRLLDISFSHDLITSANQRWALQSSTGDHTEGQEPHLNNFREFVTDTRTERGLKPILRPRGKCLILKSLFSSPFLYQFILRHKISMTTLFLFRFGFLLFGFFAKLQEVKNHIQSGKYVDRFRHRHQNEFHDDYIPL